MLDLVTTLDPRFSVAYRFGAIFLTEAYPNGPGRPINPIALLERGIEQDGGRWEYMHDIGFIYYWWLQDYAKAAEWFDRAGKAPGAPTWLAPMAATTLAVGGDRKSSRTLWRQLMESSDLDWIRSNAERRLAQLDAMDMIDQLNVIADRYEAREGHVAQSWQTLVAGRATSRSPARPGRHAVRDQSHDRADRPGAGFAAGAAARRAASAGTRAGPPARVTAMTTPDTSILVLATIMGLAIGSFLNVVIYRLPLGQSLLTPPSHVPVVQDAPARDRQRPGAVVAGAWRQVPSLQGPDLAAVSARRVRDRRVVPADHVGHANGSAAGSAAHPGGDPHHALRDRSAPSDPAEHHHAAWHRHRIPVQSGGAAGLVRQPARHPARRRHPLWDCRRATTRCATRKGWAWAT